MKTQIFLFGILMIVMYSPVKGQRKEIDSLHKLLENTTGVRKIGLLSEISRQYYQVNPEKGIAYGDQAIRMADSLKMPSAKSKALNSLGANYLALSKIDQARSCFNMARSNALLFHDSVELGNAIGRLGILCEMQGKYDSALLYMKEGYEILKKLNLEKPTGRVLENMGIVHLNRGELKSALTCLLEAERCYQKAKAVKDLPYLYLKLGRVYAESKDWTEATKWYDKGIRESERIGDLMTAGIGLNAVGILYKELGKYDSALIRYRQALVKVENLNNRNLVAAIYGNMGNVYANKGLFRDAYTYHEKAMKLGEAIKNKMLVAQEKTGMGEACLEMKDYLRARKLFEEARPVFEESKSKANLLAVYESLIAVNNAMKDYANSVKYYQEFIKVKDSLNQHERNKSLDSLRVSFQTEQTRNENEQLTQQNLLHQQTISLQRTLILAGILVSVLMVLVIVLIIRNRNRMKKSNEVLEQKNTEITIQSEELIRLNRKLLELSQFKDNMNSFLVHDMKNSLNAMIHFGLAEHSNQQAETFRHLAGQMLHIISNILDINKYENNSMPQKLVSLPLKAVLHLAFQETGYLALQKGISLVFRSASPYKVIADEAVLRRVFVNLLTNAIKYAPADGEVTILAGQVGPGFIRIEVCDKGEGIDPKFLPYIFDKFTQSDPRPSGGMPSTGIGLTFCKLAVESMGGTIGVESATEGGSVLWFSLPVCQEHEMIQPGNQPVVTTTHADFLLSEEEKREIASTCTRLKALNIYCISDVKEAVNALSSDSARIMEWKSLVLQAMYDCNESKYNELIDIDGKTAI